MVHIVVPILLFYLFSIGEAQCPNGFLQHDESCYHFSHDKEPWADAMILCKNLFGGAKLVEIFDDEENNFILKTVDSLNANFWIGATDILEEGKWKWSTSNMELQYHTWWPGNPSNSNGNENCAEIHESSHITLWNDNSCHVPQQYICERSIADGGEIVGR